MEIKTQGPDLNFNVGLSKEVTIRLKRQWSLKL